MESSVLAENHHYYVTYFYSKRLNNIDSLISLIDDKFDKEYLIEKSKNQVHVQILINRLYGSETLLFQNKKIIKEGKTKVEKTYYWYDFYIGQLNNPSKKIFYICYPYNSLKGYLEHTFFNKIVELLFIKPNVKSVLDYMKNSNRAEAHNLRKGFNASIVKYTAEIKDEANANKINLSGVSPLNSRVFDVLNNDSIIEIKTSSLKLRCSRLNVGEIDISFDKLGNYRFWIKKSTKISSIQMLPEIYDFFESIKSLKEDVVLSNKTLLEDE